MREQAQDRFSPACAGNGPIQVLARPVAPVQPRVCGERVSPVCGQGYAGGSAPRVRGTDRDFVCVPFAGRFSPACAGNGRTVLTCEANCSVQPRVCGERARRSKASMSRRGSAPRVRGTGGFAIDVGMFGRFSPACAGNGISDTGQLHPIPVQPRVCGERLGMSDFISERDGSAPRVRGTEDAAGEDAQLVRFSPACAGNGTFNSKDFNATSVQPRVCGERWFFQAKGQMLHGSAPRVRGTGFRRGLC